MAENKVIKSRDLRRVAFLSTGITKNQSNIMNVDKENFNVGNASKHGKSNKFALKILK